MSITRNLVGAAAVASASALLFTGVAQAAPAVNKVPSADYQVCGNVYKSAAWAETGAPPAAAVAVENVQVTGKLYASGGTTPILNQTVSTGADGGYCITGDSTLVPTITGGGYVTLEVTSLATSSPAATSVTSSNPWKGGLITKSTQIKTGTFLQHKVSGLDSANSFHFTVS